MSMDDEELLDALRTGLNAFDPAPASLRANALAARNWTTGEATEAVPREDADLVGSGMRSSTGNDDDGDAERIETSRDHSFEGAGHTVDLTIEFATAGASAELVVIIAPPVDTVALVSPFDAPVVIDLDSSGRAALQTAARALAVEFTARSGAAVRTPLIRLF